METCFDTELLLQWLNGNLPAKANDISQHVESCADCQQHLESLTNEYSLQPPSSEVFNNAAYTSEPHFQSLRKKLIEQPSLSSLGLLNPEANGPERSDHHDGQQRSGNGLTDPENADLKTWPANPDSTLSPEPRLGGFGDSTRTADTDEHPDSLETIEIPGFRIEKLIGRGGFARVYQGWEKRLSRTVAIKVLDANRINARNRHRFLREAKTASSIESPHVVRVLTSGETDHGRPYIVMEMVKGLSLAQWIGAAVKQTQLNTETIDVGVRLMIHACLGTQSVHDAGLIHRDIKPSNLFVDPATNTAKLGDFGLARIMDDDTVTLTRASELAGTPAYMSPEQTKPLAARDNVANESAEEFRDNVSTRSDVYSLGASLYHVVTGQPPFRGSSLSIIMQANNNAPLPPRQLNEFVSRDLETICLKALEKDPQRRYSSAADLGADLQRVIDGQPIVARPISRMERLGRWAKSNRGLATALAMLFLTLLGASIVSTTLLYRAKAAEKQANNDREAVLKTLNQLVTDLYLDVQNQGGDSKAMESVIESAIGGLESITKIDGDRSADRTMMWAHQRMGNLLSIKGDRAGTRASFESAIELARELYEAEPDSVIARCDLATTLLNLASHDQALQYELDECESLINESEPLLRSVLIDEPDHPNTWHQLLMLHGTQFGLWHRRHAFEKIIEHEESVLADLDRLQAVYEDKRHVYRTAQSIHFQLGRTHFLLANYDSATEFYQRSRRDLKSAIELHPNDMSLLESMATLDRVESFVAAEMSDNQRAIELAQSSIDTLEKLASRDPDDVSKQSQLASGYGMMYEPLMASARYPEAIEAIKESIRIYATLCDRAPNSHLLGAQAYAYGYLATAYNQIYDWPAMLEAYEAELRLATDPNHIYADGSNWASTITEIKQQLAALRMLLGKDQPPVTDTPVVRFVAFSFLARKEAETATSDNLSDSAIQILARIDPEINATTFTELFKIINATDGLSETFAAYRPQYQARVFAKRAENLAEFPDRKKEQEELIKKSIRLLEQLEDLGPLYVMSYVLTEPDFIWLRATEQFKQSSLSSP